MATIGRTSSKSNPWQVRWRDPAGKQRKKSFPRKLDAERFKSEVEHQLHTGQYVDVAAGRVTFRAYAEQWRKTQQVRPNTAARHERELRLHAYPILGDRPIASLRPSDLQAWVTALGARLSPDSVRVVHGTVRAVFTAAMRDRIIGWDPCEGVRLPEHDRREILPLTRDQVEALADTIDPRYRALVVLGAGCGLRQGELFGLRVEDVDFLRREIRVRQQVQVIKGRGPVVVAVKSRASRRTIPAADAVLAELAEHMRKHRHPDSDLVFCSRSGKPLHRTHWNEHVWHAARSAAAARVRERATGGRDWELVAELERRAEQLAHAGTHDLRHYFASALIRFGLDVKTVSVRMGHSTPATTLQVYAHLWPDAADRTREAVAVALGGGVPRMRPVDERPKVPVQVTGSRGAVATIHP